MSLSARELGVTLDLLALLDALLLLLHDPVLALDGRAVRLIGAAHLTSVPAHHLHAARHDLASRAERAGHLCNVEV